MKDSWRAGIPDKDKTELVTTGIYRFSRNPAFLGFDLMYIGVLLLYGNLLTLGFSLFAMMMLHLQILQEERSLNTSLESRIRSIAHVSRYWGRKIKTFSGEQIMSKRTRGCGSDYLAALSAYYLVHEGAHLLYALFTGVLKQNDSMGLGVQIDVYAEHMTNMQLGIFCLVGALATFCIGYLLAALAEAPAALIASCFAQCFTT